MSDPTIDAARDVLAESLDKIRRGIAGLTVDQLNAKPAGGETNSVAVIATHALSSTRSYMGIAVGAPIQAATSYANCDALHRHWQYGVAKSRKAARRQVHSGHYKPHVSRAGYRANSNLDADKDGTACEVTR